MSSPVIKIILRGYCSEPEKEKKTGDPKDVCIVHLPGRKPYDKNAFRLPDESPAAPLKEVPDGYVSVQKTINSNNGKINQRELDKYLEKAIKKGFKKIEKEDLFDYPYGIRIAYIRNDDVWRSGGYLVALKESNTEYGSDVKLNEYKRYLLYRGFNNAVFSLQFSDIREMWIKERVKKKMLVEAEKMLIGFRDDLEK